MRVGVSNRIHTGTEAVAGRNAGVNETEYHSATGRNDGDLLFVRPPELSATRVTNRRLWYSRLEENGLDREMG